MNAHTPIPEQIRLPMRVAFAVVMQGLRIRLGRSLVTITGIGCGIAFLMSILTGQTVQRGVAAEDARRAETDRMSGFIRAELPRLQARAIGVIGGGALDEVETRVLERLAADGVGDLLVLDAGSPRPRRPLDRQTTVSPDRLAADAAVVFVMGDGPVPAFDWGTFLGASPDRMVALTRADAALPGAVPAARQIRLARAWTDEELAARALRERQERFRGTWVVAVSLLVTVIGIANALLMSVTERFREIGTMKCLGALSSFVTRMFVLEAAILGLVGGVLGTLFGAGFALGADVVGYGASLVFDGLAVGRLVLYGLGCIATGVGLAMIAALYPARLAAAMVPAAALRSTV